MIKKEKHENRDKNKNKNIYISYLAAGFFWSKSIAAFLKIIYKIKQNKINKIE